MRGSTFCTLWKCIFQHFMWVEHQKFSDGIVAIWLSVIKIMDHWMPLPRSKQPKCKSYEVVKGAIKDPFPVVTLIFFSFIAGHLKPYLTIYQSQKPLIPFLYDNLKSLHKELLGLTIKSEFLGKCNDDCKELLKIDLRDRESQMKKKDMYVGFVTYSDLNNFRIDAREFLVTLLVKMFDKDPISLNIVKYVFILDSCVGITTPRCMQIIVPKAALYSCSFKNSVHHKLI